MFPLPPFENGNFSTATAANPANPANPLAKVSDFSSFSSPKELIDVDHMCEPQMPR